MTHAGGGPCGLCRIIFFNLSGFPKTPLELDAPADAFGSRLKTILNCVIFAGLPAGPDELDEACAFAFGALFDNFLPDGRTDAADAFRSSLFLAALLPIFLTVAC